MTVNIENSRLKYYSVIIMVKSIILFSLISLILSAGLIPLVIHFCRYYSLYDSVNARKIHSGNIPRLGGVAICLGFVIASILCFIFDKDHKFTNVVPILCSGTLIFVFGILDDIIEMRAIFKLLVQLVASGIVVLFDFRISQIFGWVLPIWISRAVTFCWILGIINAYNLIDGMDGLCGTLVLTSLITYGFMLISSHFEGAAVCFILAGAILGFLFYNWPLPNAKIFMGDGGSQFLGFMLATIPLYSSADSFQYNKFLLMLVIVSFPMMDTIAAIWRRLRDHRPIMSPDKSHLHHKLLNLGFDKVHALIIVISIQILICVTVYVSLFLERKYSIAILIIAYLFMIGFFSVIHFTNYAVIRKIKRDRLNGEQTITEE